MMELLTTAEAADRIGLWAESLAILVATGEIAAFASAPKAARSGSPGQTLDDYLERCRRLGPR